MLCRSHWNHAMQIALKSCYADRTEIMLCRSHWNRYADRTEIILCRSRQQEERFKLSCSILRRRRKTASSITPWSTGNKRPKTLEWFSPQKKPVTLSVAFSGKMACHTVVAFFQKKACRTAVAFPRQANLSHSHFLQQSRIAILSTAQELHVCLKNPATYFSRVVSQ